MRIKTHTDRADSQADGLLLSTPTGSTAYSLSSGGPISHPSTDTFLLTPIAPRSLSFRSVILPGGGLVKLTISPLARSPAELSIDGREVCSLSGGESVIVRKSGFPIPCIERDDGGAGWVRDIKWVFDLSSHFLIVILTVARCYNSTLGSGTRAFSRIISKACHCIHTRHTYTMHTFTILCHVTLSALTGRIK